MEATVERDAALHRIDVLEAVRAGQAETIAALRLALSIKVLAEPPAGRNTRRSAPSSSPPTERSTPRRRTVSVVCTAGRESVGAALGR